MKLHHNTLSVVLLIFVTATHHAAGVKIDSIGLETGLLYVRKQMPAHIRFKLTIEPEEELHSVVWQKDDDGKSCYEWKANESVTVSGIFLGAIDTSAPNGEVLFPQVELDYAGHYNLTVFTKSGTDTATYKLTVYDYSFIFSFPGAGENCLWPVKMMAYRVAPYPNISCVFEEGIDGAPSVLLDTIAEVEPNVTDNKNGTFNYEVAPIIPILQVPVDSWMSWQLWIEEISLPILKMRPSEIAEPCPEPDIMVNLTYNFISFPSKSCYGGYQQGTLVNYSCTDNPDLEPHKTQQCKSGRRWIDTDITPWPTCNKPPGPSTMDGSNGNSVSPSRRIQLTATFLIASYYILM